MALIPGSSFGPYQIRALLGAGGMGEVYRARDRKLGRDVALKVLPAEMLRDADRLRRFELEARSASALNHPAIVTIYDLGEAESQHYMTMELVEGETLRALLNHGALPLRRALQIAAQAADGLAKAHEAGIIHRDLKPENIMVSQDGFAKILDFGLAKLAGDSAQTADTITRTGTAAGSVMGTVSYMSPEQASGAPVDNRTDQFSFGLVLYEMLSGRRAFSRPTAAETMAAVIRDEPPLLAEVAPLVPAPVRWMVDRCLSKAPGDRYASTRDLARDLASARDNLSALMEPVHATAGPSRPRVSWRESIAWSLAALAVVALLAVWARRSEPPVSDRPQLTFTFPAPDGTRFVSTVGLNPFAISPDGRSVAFVAAPPEGPRQLWIHSFDSLGSQPIAGTNGAANPFWSPDGKWVAFFAQGLLKRASIAAGNVATICEAAGGAGGAWNNDDIILFSPGLERPMYRVTAAGSTPVAVTTLDAAHKESGHSSPVFLPDGRRFAFQVLGGDRPGTYLGSLDSSTPTQLSSDLSTLGFRPPDVLFFVRDRTLFSQRIDMDRMTLVGEPARVADDVQIQGPTSMFSVSTTGAVLYWTGSRTITQPTWFSRKGESLGTVGRPGGYVNLALSPDGKHVLADRFDPAPGIWDLDVARGTATRQTSGPIYQSTPLWTPDGKAFAFASATSDGPPNLYFKAVQDTAEERLTTSANQSFPQSWSPDGQSLVYLTTDPKTARDLWLLPLSGDRRPRPLLQTPASESHGRVSPDGRWLVYVSNESGSPGVYVTRFPETGGKWQVSRTTSVAPLWSRDGRDIFYVTFDDQLMAVPVTAGTEFSAGTPVPLFKVPNAVLGGVGNGWGYDVAADGRFLINMFVERTSPPAVVLLNRP